MYIYRDIFSTRALPRSFVLILFFFYSRSNTYFTVWRNNWRSLPCGAGPGMPTTTHTINGGTSIYCGTPSSLHRQTQQHSYLASTYRVFVLYVSICGNKKSTPRTHLPAQVQIPGVCVFSLECEQLA